MGERRAFGALGRVCRCREMDECLHVQVQFKHWLRGVHRRDFSKGYREHDLTASHQDTLAAELRTACGDQLGESGPSRTS